MSYPKIFAPIVNTFCKMFCALRISILDSGQVGVITPWTVGLFTPHRIQCPDKSVRIDPLSGKETDEPDDKKGFRHQFANVSKTFANYEENATTVHTTVRMLEDLLRMAKRVHKGNRSGVITLQISDGVHSPNRFHAHNRKDGGHCVAYWSNAYAPMPTPSTPTPSTPTPSTPTPSQGKVCKPRVTVERLHHTNRIGARAKVTWYLHKVRVTRTYTWDYDVDNPYETAARDMIREMGCTTMTIRAIGWGKDKHVYACEVAK